MPDFDPIHSSELTVGVPEPTVGVSAPHEAQHFVGCPLCRNDEVVSCPSGDCKGWIFPVPSSKLKLTLPKHTLEGLNSEVSLLLSLFQFWKEGVQL